MSSEYKLDQNQNETIKAKNEKIIAALKTFQFVKDPFRTPTASEESMKRERMRAYLNDSTTDGLYCKAEPGSEEWKRYQSARLKSLKELKRNKLKTSQKETQEKQKVLKKPKGEKVKPLKKEKDEILPTAVRSSSLKQMSRSGSVASRESINSITWKEPIDDSDVPSTTASQFFFPARSSPYGTKKRSKSPKARKSSPNLHRKGRRPSVGKIHDLRGGKLKPRRKSNSSKGKAVNTSTGGKTENTPTTQKTEIIGAKGKDLSSPKVGAAESSSPKVKSSHKPKTKLQSYSTKTLPSSILNKRQSAGGNRKHTAPKVPQEPEFPSIKLCDAYPGTPQWDSYWEYFNGEMKNYHKKVNRYQRLNRHTNREFGKFVDKVTEETVANNIFRLNVGLQPGTNKPPLLRQPITESMTLIGGYTIRRVKLSKELKEAANVLLTTFDYKGFRLEIDHPKLSMDLSSYSVKKDSEYNLIVISLFDGGQGASGATEQIHIGVPLERSVEHIVIGAPADNGGKLVASTSGKKD